MISATTGTANNRGGNGKYRPLARKRKEENVEDVQFDEFVYLDSTDSRMRFNTSKDPIYFAFEYLEKRSVLQLTKDFIKDSMFEITNFVSKVAK